MSLDSSQLETFLAVVQTGSYRLAADLLFVTQPAVTQRIQALEKSLQRQLFVRTGRGFSLTDSGQLFLTYCRDRAHSEAQFLAEFNGGDGLSGQITIACGSAEGRTWLLPVLNAIGQEHPALDITLHIDDNLDPVAALESGQVQATLGETPFRRRGLRSVKVGTIAYGLAISPAISQNWPDTPLAAQLKAVRAIDYHARDRVTLDLLDLCLPGEDFSDLRRHYVNDMHGLVTWVELGGGFSALPLPLIRTQLQTGRLRLLYPQQLNARSLYWTLPSGMLSHTLHLLVERLRDAVEVQ